MQIHLVSPSDYIHHKSFEPQRDALKEATIGLADDRHLLLAAHLWKSNMELGEVPKDWIIYNCEQVGAGMGADTAYLDLLRRHEVWDYSKENIKALEAVGIKARYCGVGYSPCLTRTEIIDADPEKQDIDVLFYGSINERRKAVLMELNEKCRLKVVFGVYGEALHGYIARSKIVLNMHYYDTAIHEITRTSYLMANRKCVISEVGKDNLLEEPYFEAMTFCPYDELVDACLDYVQQPELRGALGSAGYEIFKERGQREMVESALAL